MCPLCSTGGHEAGVPLCVVSLCGCDPDLERVERGCCGGSPKTTAVAEEVLWQRAVGGTRPPRPASPRGMRVDQRRADAPLDQPRVSAEEGAMTTMSRWSTPRPAGLVLRTASGATYVLSPSTSSGRRRCGGGGSREDGGEATAWCDKCLARVGSSAQRQPMERLRTRMIATAGTVSPPVSVGAMPCGEDVRHMATRMRFTRLLSALQRERREDWLECGDAFLCAGQRDRENENANMKSDGQRKAQVGAAAAVQVHEQREVAPGTPASAKPRKARSMSLLASLRARLAASEERVAALQRETATVITATAHAGTLETARDPHPHQREHQQKTAQSDAPAPATVTGAATGTEDVAEVRRAAAALSAAESSRVAAERGLAVRRRAMVRDVVRCAGADAAVVRCAPVYGVVQRRGVRRQRQSRLDALPLPGGQATVMEASQTAQTRPRRRAHHDNTGRSCVASAGAGLGGVSGVGVGGGGGREVRENDRADAGGHDGEHEAAEDEDEDDEALRRAAAKDHVLDAPLPVLPSWEAMVHSVFPAAVAGSRGAGQEQEDGGVAGAARGSDWRRHAALLLPRSAAEWSWESVAVARVCRVVLLLAQVHHVTLPHPLLLAGPGCAVVVARAEAAASASSLPLTSWRGGKPAVTRPAPASPAASALPPPSSPAPPLWWCGASSLPACAACETGALRPLFACGAAETAVPTLLLRVRPDVFLSQWFCSGASSTAPTVDGGAGAGVGEAPWRSCRVVSVSAEERAFASLLWARLLLLEDMRCVCRALGVGEATLAVHGTRVGALLRCLLEAAV